MDITKKSFQFSINSQFFNCEPPFDGEKRAKRHFQRSFTLIELLIVIAIISILIGVLVPNISRSLSSNRLSSDVDVLRAKIEETRLLAGSTQVTDRQTGATIIDVNLVGYYGIYFPAENVTTSNDNYNGKPFYALVRLSKPFTSDADGYCNPKTIETDALGNSGRCLIERIDLSSNVEFDFQTTQQNRMIAFVVPAQQLVELYLPDNQTGCNLLNGYCWVENASGPIFDQKSVNNPYIRLKNNNKAANINVMPYTGKLEVTYQ